MFGLFGKNKREKEAKARKEREEKEAKARKEREEKEAKARKEREEKEAHNNIYYYCKKSNIKLLKSCDEILDNSINKLYKDKLSLLNIAIRSGHTSTVELLLSKGANIEEEVDDIASFEDIYEDIYEDISIEFKGLEYKEVVSPTTGRIWLDRNLGATQVAQSPDDKKSYGDYYQWGREADGHEKKDSNNFITVDRFTDDWTYEDKDGSKRSYFWSKIDGSGICPPGYRVPTIEELELEMKEGNWDNTDDCFNSFLKLPLAGDRSHSDASLDDQGSSGYVWSSSVDDSSSWCLFFGSNLVDSDLNYRYYRANGRSVRCIKGE